MADPGLKLGAVADGQGGRHGGGTASEVAVRTLRGEVEAALDAGLSGRPLQERMRTIVRRCHETVQLEGIGLLPAGLVQGEAGMGTTLTACVLDRGMAYVARAGNSPAFVVRNGELRRLAPRGDAARERAWLAAIEGVEDEVPAAHPEFEVLGREIAPSISSLRIHAKPGDVLVLATDGLTWGVSERDIVEVVLDESSLLERARELVERAQGVSFDDATVVLCAVD